jgi:peptide/nickel transport system permease protein
MVRRPPKIVGKKFTGSLEKVFPGHSARRSLAVSGWRGVLGLGS